MIVYEIAPFGKFPYGREFIGNLHYETNTGCSPFKVSSAKHNNMPCILMIPDGDCSPKVKAINAELAGTQLLVIMSNDVKSNDSLLQQSFDSTTLSINIPTIVVSHEVGSKLVELIDKLGSPMLKFTMPIPQYNTVVLDFYLRLSDTNFYGFLKSLDSYVSQFGTGISSTFMLYLEEANENSAKEVAELQIMVDCLDQNEVFKILGLFAEACVNKKMINSKCFEMQISETNQGILSSWKHCYNKASQSSLQSLIRKAESNFYQGSSSLMINKLQYSGSFKAENVFEAICSAFIKSPDNCIYLNNKYTSSDRYNDMKKSRHVERIWLIGICVSILFILLVIASLILVTVFGKIYQQILRERVEKLVKNSVDRYNQKNDHE